jgi:hypothetical protein
MTKEAEYEKHEKNRGVVGGRSIFNLDDKPNSVRRALFTKIRQGSQ